MLIFLLQGMQATLTWTKLLSRNCKYSKLLCSNNVWKIVKLFDIYLQLSTIIYFKSMWLAFYVVNILILFLSIIPDFFKSYCHPLGLTIGVTYHGSSFARLFHPLSCYKILSTYTLLLNLIFFVISSHVVHSWHDTTVRIIISFYHHLPILQDPSFCTNRTLNLY